MVQIIIDGKTYDVPADLSEIPLGRFLEYYQRYGIDLDAELTNILKREYADEFDREADLSGHEDLEALTWFTFWTGLDLTKVKNAEAMPLLVLYRSVKTLLVNSESEACDLPALIEWEGKEWEIRDFKVTHKSDYTFNELLVSKEVVRQIKSIGKGKWESLPYLCAVFFRLKGEAFTEVLVDPEGERMQLLMKLPLSHAFKVTFFLTVSINIWSKGLAFSREAAAALNPR